MIWANSTYLWLLLLLPLIWAGYWWIKVRNREKAFKLFDERLLKTLRLNYWTLGDKVRFGSIMVAALFFILALAGPKIGTEIREIERTGLNMVIALDLSRSMNAEDVPPSRLQKAKFEINRLINRLEGDRVGLIVFTGEAFVQSPMTQDYSALRLFLDIAETDQMPTSTTNFNSAMVKAVETFESISEEYRDASNVLLFIADGENHGPDFMPALRQLTQMGVTTFSVGIGTEEGGRIPIYDNGNLQGYHRDRDGNVVTTRLSSQTMRQIAAEGNGNYYEISSGSDTIEPFFSRLDELERGEFSAQQYSDYKNRYQVLLVIGLFFFCIGLFFPDYKLKSDSLLNS